MTPFSCFQLKAIPFWPLLHFILYYWFCYLLQEFYWVSAFGFVTRSSPILKITPLIHYFTIALGNFLLFLFLMYSSSYIGDHRCCSAQSTPEHCLLNEVLRSSLQSAQSHRNPSCTSQLSPSMLLSIVRRTSNCQHKTYAEVQRNLPWRSEPPPWYQLHWHSLRILAAFRPNRLYKICKDIL